MQNDAQKTLKIWANVGLINCKLKRRMELQAIGWSKISEKKRCHLDHFWNSTSSPERFQGV